MDQVGHNLWVLGLVNKVVDDKVGINLRYGKEEGKYSIGPMVSGPGSFEAWDSVMEIVVIINSMTKFEMPLKGFHIVEGVGLVLAVGILPKLLHLPSIDGGEQAASCHDVHAILWLLHEPNIIFDAINHQGCQIASTLPTAFSLKYSRICSLGTRVGQHLHFLSMWQQKHPSSSTPPMHTKHRTHNQEQCIDTNGTPT